MTLKGAFGPHTISVLQWDMVRGQKLMVHLVLKVVHFNAGEFQGPASKSHSAHTSAMLYACLRSNYPEALV